MNVRGEHARRSLDLDSGPSSSDTTGIIRPCSTFSFPHLTSLEPSFLYPVRQFDFLSRYDMNDNNGEAKGREGRSRGDDLQSGEIRLRGEFLDRFN